MVELRACVHVGVVQVVSAATRKQQYSHKHVKVCGSAATQASRTVAVA